MYMCVCARKRVFAWVWSPFRVCVSVWTRVVVKALVCVCVCVCLRGFSCARDCVRPLLRVYVRAPRPIPQRPSPIIERKFFRLVDG